MTTKRANARSMGANESGRAVGSGAPTSRRTTGGHEQPPKGHRTSEPHRQQGRRGHRKLGGRHLERGSDHDRRGNNQHSAHEPSH